MRSDRPRYGSPPPDYRVRADVERLRVHTAMTEVVGAVSEPDLPASLSAFPGACRAGTLSMQCACDAGHVARAAFPGSDE